MNLYSGVRPGPLHRRLQLVHGLANSHWSISEMGYRRAVHESRVGLQLQGPQGLLVLLLMQVYRENQYIMPANKG